jgi:SNF2 family DNA or RNA helicase
MQMRLGKTLTAIRWLEEKLPLEGRVLIVSPLSVVPVWGSELKLEGHSHYVVHGDLDHRLRVCNMEASKHSKLTAWLIGYETLRCTPSIAYEDYWDAVILDESTKIKNSRAGITKLVTRGFRSAPHRGILSGFPAPESLMDYYTQFLFLNNRFMGSNQFHFWKHEWFRSDANGWDWQPMKGSREAIQKAVASRAYVLTRKDAGIDEERVDEVRYVGMSPSQKSRYVLAKEAFRGTEGQTTKYAMVRFMWMQRIAGGMNSDGTKVISWSKFDELVELLRGELRGESVVVWFRFNAEILAAENRIRQKFPDCRVRTLYGDMPPVDRKRSLEKFTSGRARVLLAQEALGQFGLDLSVSSTVVRYSSGYSAEIRTQSDDRVIHPKKKDRLLYLNLVTVGSTDELVQEAVENKEWTSRQFLRRVYRLLREEARIQ